jgi:glucose/arabinose dehydrogenase
VASVPEINRVEWTSALRGKGIMRQQLISLAVFAMLFVSATGAQAQLGPEVAARLPKPYATESAIKHPKVIGWPEGKMPSAPEGFRVSAFARAIENPRWIYVLPNGDVLVAQSRMLPKPAQAAAESTPAEKQKDIKMDEGLKQSKTVTGGSPNKITLLRDANGDGEPELRATLLAELNQPLGMALVSDRLLVACTDAVLSFPFQLGQTRIDAQPVKIMDLPAGGYNNHWTRNLITNKTGTKIYISVGSASNVAEHGTAEELLRANILEANIDGTGLCVFASGIRNPVGMDWHPTSGKLWTAVNERDGLGDDLVPDYLTSVERGGFYGWPFAYFGPHEDPRLAGQRPDLVEKTIVPDLSLGSHTASLGLVFYTASSFPERYRGGAFVGQRGSWNRSQFVGYRVAFVPFRGAQPTGEVEDFLTGFIANDSEVYGRPVGVAVAADGSLLVADEPGNTVWRVSTKN